MGAGGDGIGVLVGRIVAELEMPMGRLEAVTADCAELTLRLEAPLSPETTARLWPLMAELSARAGPIVAPVADVLARAAEAAAEPALFIEAMLGARDAGVVRRALGIARHLVAGGREEVARVALRGLAVRAGAGDALLEEPEVLHAAAALARAVSGARAATDVPAGAPRLSGGDPIHAARPSGEDVVRVPHTPREDPIRAALIEDDDLAVRLLAARLLDLDGAPATMDVVAAMLGEQALRLLRPYLQFTRAGYVDLLHLAPRRGAPVTVLPSLVRAERACGPALLREIVATLGWPRVCLGVEARRLAGVSVRGSIPLFARPAEARLLEGCDGARRVCERIVVTAHGGLPAAGEEAAPRDDPVVRYRGYNLAHAGMLQEILDVAPLSPERLDRLVGRMDDLVATHVALFSACAEDCAILPGVWRDLRARIEAARAGEGGDPVLSPELTRLVLAFEDPSSAGAVHTLHGLKRWLHQAGLKLGSRLVGAARATNRTVDVVVASPEGILGRAGGIQYVDFEPADDPGAPPEVPYPVAVVADGFARALLHGAPSLPTVRVFRYGNEVHYYLAYRNHPAFARVFFAPPLRGGMVDLEYYGVSRYELAAHPGRELEAVQAFFRRLEFDVQVEANTRVHARYDKEQARDLADVCDRAEALFRLAPHLMDLDWTLGDLALRDEARREAVRAWAERFVLWGVVPDGILTRDRLGILADVEEGPDGGREIAWSGEGLYRDRRSGGDPAKFLVDLSGALAALDPETWGGAAFERASFGQIALEREVLGPLRDAVALGAIEVCEGALRAAPAVRYERAHEAEAFARMLDADSGGVAAAARVARIVQAIERETVFRVTGAVNGHPVQRARLPLHGRAVTLHALRDPAGMARLALWSRGASLSRRRPDPATPWERDASADAARLAALLRAAGYEPEADVGPSEAVAETAALRDLFHRPNPHAGAPARSGERVVQGVPASAGRAVGRAAIGGAGRRSSDLAGAVLVVRTLRPEDGPLLAGAAGVLSTGGGVLSHAGLIATQYGRPALIVPGAWRAGLTGAERLALRYRVFREEEGEIGGLRLTRRLDERESEWLLAEGDLLVLDADREEVRVLGREAGTLALHDGIRAFGAAGRRLAAAADDVEGLALRGARLRARHRIESVLARLADPMTVRHAVHEILLGDDLAGAGGGPGEKAALLALLLANPRAGGEAREELGQRAGELARRRRAAVEQALGAIPRARTLHEVLAPRLQALRLGDACRDASACLAGCGLPAVAADDAAMVEIQRETLRALKRIGARLRDDVIAAAPVAPLVRHRLRELERLDALLGVTDAPGVATAARALGERDARTLETLRDARVLAAGASGLEGWPLAGWKAANLAEIARLAGAARVPPWFAVTDAAFREALDMPRRLPGGMAPATTLREAIEGVLARDDMDARARAAAIRALWEQAELPEPLVRDFAAAFAVLDPGGEDALVAVRSSALAEDTELAAHAGEFDTFLYVRGETEARAHLKRAWAGLWNERALAMRARAPGETPPGGGVIVQRMVDARVSGVIQTIHAASGDPRRIVVNAGLGLGEGVVSGAVAADLVTVSKDGDLRRGPLRFHYVTADKREQIVFDRGSGSGTVRAETLYHQRMRPALEYVELLELVGAAADLEEAYGHPLDIEFAIERDRLWILQVRPVPAHGAVVRETLERHPLKQHPIATEEVPT